MAFRGGPLRAPAQVRLPVTVFAVGRRVCVAARTGDVPARVSLTDERGKSAGASLGDGAEVTILAWRPGWASATQYCVRSTESGVEGWLPGGNLRGTNAAIASADAEPPTAGPSGVRRVGELEGPGRRFGQR